MSVEKLNKKMEIISREKTLWETVGVFGTTISKRESHPEITHTEPRDWA